MIALRTIAMLCVAAVPLLGGGCLAISPEPAADWIVGDAAGPDDPAAGQMQILIWYDMIPHTAMRLDAPGRRPLYWDPAGTFAEGSTRWTRVNDLFLDPAPTTAEVWEYWSGSLFTRAIEVFEFDLPAAEVAEMQEALLGGSREPGRPGTFNPGVEGAVCCQTVCRFLQGWQPRRIDLPETYTYPHNLARHLWTQRPSRVHLYSRGRPRMTYLPPPDRPRPPRRVAGSAE